MTTDYNYRVVKIHFQDNVPTEKRKKVKGAILKENAEILIADMKSEYNVKTQKFDLVPCDIILSVNGAESLQDFKARITNIYKSEFNILSPCPCPGGERIVIMLKRGNGKEEIKFLTVSLWNKDSKIMVQGTSDNLDRFITDYIEILGEEKRKEKNFEEQPEGNTAKSDVFTKEATEFDLNTESDEYKDESEKDDSDDDIIITKSNHNPKLELHQDDANANLESKPIEDIINIINDNQRDIFEEMNKFNETRINSLISEMNKLSGAFNNQLEINQDIEVKFQNKLKQQQEYFEKLIQDQDNFYNSQIKEIKQELSKTKDTVRDLKSQLKNIQKNNKKENDIELSPDMKALDSSLKLNLNHEPNESHIKNPLNTSEHSQCLETSELVDSKETNAIEIPTSPVIPKHNNIHTHLSDVPEKIGDLTHPSKQKRNHEIIIQKDKPSSFSEVVKNSHKLSANNSIEQQTQTAVPTNTSHSNQPPRNPISTFSTRQNDPILLLGDSMIKGIKENLLDRNTFVKKNLHYWRNDKRVFGNH